MRRVREPTPVFHSTDRGSREVISNLPQAKVEAA